ncbi:MAG: peptide ABC transporter substrate-binding protein [Spirochaetia bacterium]
MKKLSIMLLVLLIAVTGLFAGGGQEAEEEPVEFVLYNGGEPQSLDPANISGVPEHRIYMSLFEGLVSYDPETLEATPGVAESWEVSDDGMQYTFHLREDAQWSDGTPITAQTFVDSWLRFLSPDTAAVYSYMVNMVIAGARDYNAGEAGPDAVQIRAVDDHTFQFDLTGPAPYVLGMLAHYAFAPVPLHVIEEYGDEWTRPENFVGNGPFTLENWRPQQELTVVPNETYWDAEAVQLDRVVYLPIEDNVTAYNMYKNGEMDWCTTVPLDSLDEARLREDYHNNPALITYYYVFNVEREPLDDSRVRKALSMAIDRQELVEMVTRGGQIPAFDVCPPLNGYEPVEGNPEDFDLAREYLADAGFPGGEGFPELEILYNTSEGHRKIAEYIQQKWSEVLGIDVTLVNQEWQTYLASRNEHDFEIARAGWAGDYQDPNTFLDMFITGSGNNSGEYSNPEYDRLIDEAATMPGGPERNEVLRRASQILHNEDQGIMPLYYYAITNMIDTDVWGGWYENTLDIHPLKDIYRIPE